MKLFSIKKNVKDVAIHYDIRFLGLKFKFKHILDERFASINKRKFDDNLSLEDKKYYITKLFEEKLGYTPNIDNPKSFNEKLQWLKLYENNPLMTIGADKYKVRDYIKEKIGEEYLIPLLGVYDNPESIDFDALPEKFAIKVNWGSGQNIIVKDKSTLDLKKTREKLRKWMKKESNHYYRALEPSYKNIEPKIIIEEYQEQQNKDLYDYKFICMNGEAKCLFVVSDRFTNTYIDWYDLDWNLLPFKRKYENSPNGIEKPANFEQMLDLANNLAKDFTFVRVDFYSLENKIYFGELTFFPGNGMEDFQPVEWDYKIGELLKLPIENKQNSETLVAAERERERERESSSAV